MKEKLFKFRTPNFTMVKKYTDSNGVSHYSSAIGKFERLGRNAGKITAQNIPTRFMRSGILAMPQSQSFKDVSHSDLIRID